MWRCSRLPALRAHNSGTLLQPTCSCCPLTLYGSCGWTQASDCSCLPRTTSCSPRLSPQRTSPQSGRLENRRVTVEVHDSATVYLTGMLFCTYLETVHWQVSWCWGLEVCCETVGWSSEGGGWWTAVWASDRTPGSASAWRSSRLGSRCCAATWKEKSSK